MLLKVKVKQKQTRKSGTQNQFILIFELILDRLKTSICKADEFFALIVSESRFVCIFIYIYTLQ